MTQQDIFQNVTKGEWAQYNYQGKTVIATGNPIKNGSLIVATVNRKDDAESMCLMKKSTIDKGINPESVEKNNVRLEKSLHIIQEMLNYLPDVVETTDGKIDLSPLKSKAIKFTNESEEALTASKLK